MQSSLFYQFPVLWVAVFTLAVLLIVLDGGFRVGLKQRKNWKNAETGGGTVALSSMFALLGLILAFTYASGLSKYEARKQAVIAESNAIETAFLRADLIDEPGRTQLKTALFNYAKTRIIPYGEAITDEMFGKIIQQTLQTQAQIWPILKKVVRKGRPNAIDAGLISAVNDVLDKHAIRMAAVVDRLPSLVLWMLIFIASATMSVIGFNAGLTGKISRWRTTVLAMVLAGVMMTIIDFDRPRAGFIRVSHSSLQATVHQMDMDLAQYKGIEMD